MEKPFCDIPNCRRKALKASIFCGPHERAGKLLLITSNLPGKHCDKYPAESLHNNASLIHNFCDVKEVPEQQVKVCPVCRLDFAIDAEFIDGQQKGEYPCCIRCYGRSHCQNHYAYMDAIVRQTVKLIEVKYNLKIEI